MNGAEHDPTEGFGHLGDHAAALVDGELGSAARDAALSHLAGCAACRAEVEAQRELKARLRDLTDPELSGDLTHRLMSLAAVDQAALEPTAPRVLSRRSATRVRPYRRRLPRVSRRSRIGVGSASLLLATTGLLLGLGSQTEGEQPVSPPVGTFVQQHTATNVEVPFNDPAVAAVTTVFTR